MPVVIGTAWWIAQQNLIFNRPKNPPDEGPPGGWIQGPRRGRQYGPDGMPEYDIDKPHQGGVMKFIESQLLGIQIDESGRELVLSLLEQGGARFALKLHGVERLLINDFRQQNVIEEIIHWRCGHPLEGLREAAFALIANIAEKDCAPQLAEVVSAATDRISRGEIEMMEISAVYGAQVIALFQSVSLVGD